MKYIKYFFIFIISAFIIAIIINSSLTNQYIQQFLRELLILFAAILIIFIGINLITKIIKKKRIRINQKFTPWFFLALPLTMYLIWVIIPIFQSFIYSFTQKDSILTDAVFVGFSNYIRLFHDPVFYTALKNNFWWLLLFVLLPIPIGLFIAMLFDMSFRGGKIYKTLFYLPMTLSFAVIATIWAWIYLPEYGALNTLLRIIGLPGLAKQWLGDEKFMTFALITVGIWRQVPYIMILYLAGLKNVPTELIEASMVDGAGALQRFRHIIIPMLAPATVVSVTISVIDSLRAFDIVYVMTNSQARAAEVLASFMYSSSFKYMDFGYGSSIAVFQFIITLGFIMVYLNNALKNEEGR